MAPALAALALAAVAWSGCTDEPVTAPGGSPSETSSDDGSSGGAWLVRCTADVARERLGCARGDGSAGPPAEFTGQATSVAIGGQGTYVQLSSSNPSFDEGSQLFTADVTIQNLLPQEMGTPDFNFGYSILVPFHEGPTNGVLPTGPNVGYQNPGYTISGPQLYVAYHPDSARSENTLPWLVPGETSKALQWQFDTTNMPDGTDSTFTFSVFVYPELPYPNGWVEVDPDTVPVAVGNNVTMTATVKDLTGSPVAGRTITWSSLDAAAATVNSSTGEVTGVLNRTAKIVAESDGPEAPDTAAAWVFVDVADRTRLTTPYDPVGPRNFRFVVPSLPSASVQGPTLARVLRPEGRREGGGSAGGSEPSGPQLFAVTEGTDAVVGFAVDSIDTSQSGGGSGPNLRVRYDRPPDLSLPFNIDFYAEPYCNSYYTNVDEFCEFADPTPGNWYVTVDQGSDFVEADVIVDYAANDPGFDIELVFIDDGLTSAQQDTLRDIADYLQAVVTNDLVPSTAWWVQCLVGVKEYYATDDLVILIRTYDDAAGGVLGSGGACSIRDGGTDTNLPVLGVLSLDLADLAVGQALDDPDAFHAVALHELTHVLGLGPLWDDFSLVSGAGGSDPLYTGSGGKTGYAAVGGPSNTDVPVENTGDAGTRDAHWRESVFGTELMTGYYNGGQANPYSELSIRSLTDLGYSVDPTQADAYTVPPSAFVEGQRQIPFGDDLWKGPVYQTQPDGTIRRIR